jgi:demethylmenaquinone methyltransferase/2-methoxy-6-polyprenyl-1,4-benzoquinol methylase
MILSVLEEPHPPHKGLPSSAEKASVVRAMFNRIAPHYDALNRLFSFRLDQAWRRETIKNLGISSGDIVLDLACGTGDFSELAVRAGARRVIGVDFAEQMLRGARQRHIQAEFIQADASCLPCRSEWISVVVSGFALRNFVSIPAMLTEVARVTRSGGRVAFLEVDTPHNVLLRWGHGVYFNHIVPFVGGLLSDSWAYAYLPKSVAYLPEPAALCRLFEDAGFRHVTKHPLSGGIAQLLTAVK